jgi:TolB protein
MTGPDPLREELRELADAVAPADLYERSLARSRRLGRREAAVGTTAAVVALALLGSGLWQLPRSGRQPVAPVAGPPIVASASAPAVSQDMSSSATSQAAAPPRKSRPDRPRPAATTSSPRSTSIADLPGHIFYADTGDEGRLVRLTPGDQLETVLSKPYATVGVSPDGARVAYVADGNLMVVDTGGGEPQQAYAGTASAAQAPAWSPDGAQLLIDATEPAVLDVATGTLTPLPSGLDGQHFRWSGDGSTLVYATAGCGLEVAETNAQSGTPVPESGDTAGRAACRPVSVDATGDLVTVHLEQNTADPAGTTDSAAAPADAVLDTVTGDIVDLPVSGRIIGAVFDPAGNLLVRSYKDGKRKLSLFAPDFTLLLRAREPASLRSLSLVAYTR